MPDPIDNQRIKKLVGDKSHPFFETERDYPDAEALERQIDKTEWADVAIKSRDEKSSGLHYLYTYAWAEFKGPAYREAENAPDYGRYGCVVIEEHVYGEKPPTTRVGEERPRDHLVDNPRLNVGRMHRTWVEASRAGTGRGK
jgi:hypothetical protein